MMQSNKGDITKHRLAVHSNNTLTWYADTVLPTKLMMALTHLIQIGGSLTLVPPDLEKHANLQTMFVYIFSNLCKFLYFALDFLC